MSEISDSRLRDVETRYRSPSLAETWAQEDDRYKAAEARRIADAKADANAVWALADYLMPPDFKEMAAQFGMSETMQEMWRNVFIAGWRAALRKPPAASPSTVQETE